MRVSSRPSSATAPGGAGTQAATLFLTGLAAAMVLTAARLAALPPAVDRGVRGRP